MTATTEDRSKKSPLLLREALGDGLRRARIGQNRTLREVSTLARVSLGYLSEVERGRKEASSELLASICDALDIPLAGLLADAGESLERDAAVARQPQPGTAAVSANSAETGSLRYVIPSPSTTAFVAA